MAELKPCPFCGGTDLEKENNKVVNDNNRQVKKATNFWIFCHTCSAMGSDGETKKDSIAAWNKRVKEEDK